MGASAERKTARFFPWAPRPSPRSVTDDRNSTKFNVHADPARARPPMRLQPMATPLMAGHTGLNATMITAGMT